MSENPVKHHPRFYIEDGSAISKVDRTLYKLHASLLKSSSPILRDMFAMPTESKPVDQASLIEGASDEYPIQLQAPVTAEKFNDLLLWFYKKALEHILEMTTFFMMDDGRNWSIAEIEGCGLTAVQTLLMGQKYRISGWVATAVHRLLFTTQARLTLSDYHNLGIHNVFVLDQARTQIQDHRLAVAFNPPKVVHNYTVCDRHCGPTACAEAWKDAWWGGFARHYIQPDTHISPQEAMAKLENVLILDMTTECYLKTIEFITAKGVIAKEDAYVAATVVALT
ncbi:hypothetical protein JB92DRAFT_3142630 [Gautieria morchelliformis]|nr:hypothetical protein JB92DRAFT_3142630 [Gautieria morchelliformis]